MYLILIMISYVITLTTEDNGMCARDAQCTETLPENRYTAGL